MSPCGKLRSVPLNFGLIQPASNRIKKDFHISVVSGQ